MTLRLTHRITRLTLLAGLAVSAASPVFAQSATLNVSRFGIYESFGAFSHSPNTGSLPRYDVGSPAQGVEARNYFVFDLSTVSFTVTSATLRIFSPSVPQSSNASDTLNIRNVSTPLNTLINSPEGTGAYGPIFTDLGDGTIYGTRTLNPATIAAGTSVDILLTGAIADINAANASADRRFGVGGQITTLNNPPTLYFSGGTFPPNAQLLLQGTASSAAAPEPAALTLLALGLTLRGIARRRAARA
jgi:hypothetical protein